jgi:hypothetical protein
MYCDTYALLYLLSNKEYLGNIARVFLVLSYERIGCRSIMYYEQGI